MMISLDAEVIRQSLRDATTARLAEFEVFAEIDSTNSLLMRHEGPVPGQVRIAATTNQTMGRGRHGRTWQSPAGSGLCLSIAYTFAAQPANLPALTLAIGLGAINALEEFGAAGVQLKWPNDLVAHDGKLAGILTETQPRRSGAITVVTGIGMNVELGEQPDLGIDSDRALGAVDLAGIVDVMPPCNTLAARLIDELCEAFVDFETRGFDACAHKWSEYDWLLGRAVTVDTPQRRVSGVGAGVADDGALLVDTGAGEYRRVTSGSVSLVGVQGTGA